MVIKIKKNTKKNDLTNLRILIVVLIIVIFFGYVIFNLFKLQFLRSEELSQKAYNQQLKNQIISPSRGTIFDSNGEILAQSIAVDTISLNPGKVTLYDGKICENEFIAEGMSKIFDVTYEKMMDELTSGKSVIIVQKKVEKSKVQELKNWMKENGVTAGINIDEDSKRYYPYSTLASNLIGFCGTDNFGQAGIEERWNSVLTGTAGKIVTKKDLEGNPISDEDVQYIASENGSNIYLTIDTAIQGITEKYLKQAMTEHKSAKSATAIIMNPTTGEILSMVSCPDYNLNSPSDYTATGIPEEEWNALDSNAKVSNLLELWKNRAVTSTYEPGSTFKLITASIGLEEGLVNTDTPNDFNCTGSYLVADYDIKCWRSAQPHGSQTLRQALCNSCNPAFMQLGQRIGGTLLYKYYKAFGFFEPIGSNIAKAYKGQFTKIEEVGPVEIATASFGQRFEISPLQMITAVSAICNDGILVKPKIVNKIENTDYGSSQVIETEEVRQVISKDTADKIKNMMQSVVTDGTGKNAAVSGYSIGGKSGTSEPRNSNLEDGYVASFVAISPIENTQVVCLVALYGLAESENHQGGQVAGPICSQILSEVLPVLKIASTSNQETEKEVTDKTVVIPDVRDLTIEEAINKLDLLGFNVVCNSVANQSVTYVQDQVPKYGVVMEEGSTVCLYGSSEEERVKVIVPNVKDMTKEQAKNVLKAHNLNANIEGTTGVVVTQTPTFETEVEEGTVIDLVIKSKLIDGQ